MLGKANFKLLNPKLKEFNVFSVERKTVYIIQLYTNKILQLYNYIQIITQVIQTINHYEIHISVILRLIH